ncbi:phage baseplate assembly protein V [Salinicola tamaricis]|uniref:phage baseplate assembly protein V n=1 Tax=Salinicola tamaricis TaxID=1771309 RepID=UPI000D09DCD4|nr:phage baseplate assembly protein V [Salinicola tamaricis]
MNPVELARLLHNLIRVGRVAAIDHAAVRVRIQSGALLTDWLPWLTARAGHTRSWNPPTLGEQVLLLAPGGELRGALVLPALNSDAVPAPSHDANLTQLEMPDGAVIAYDHAASHLSATLPGSASLDAQGAVSVTTAAALTATAAAGATLNADTVINGNLTLNGNFSQPSGQTATMAGDVRFTGAVTSNGRDISASHTHGGVKRGGDQTDGVN